MDGGGPALSAWVEAECNRVLGQESTEAEGRVRADLARKARRRELEKWEPFKAFSLVRMGARSKEMADTRWAVTWKKVDGVKTAEARLLAEGYQDPDLRNGGVDIACCVCRKSPHLRLIFLGAPKTSPIWNLDVENASPQADGFNREVHLRDPCERNPKDARRVRRLRAPAYGLNDAPVASHQPLRKY